MYKSIRQSPINNEMQAQVELRYNFDDVASQTHLMMYEYKSRWHRVEGKVL